MSLSFDRVLIAARAVLGRRILQVYGEEGIETVSVFNEPDAEQPWLEEADFAVYLNGATARETYLHPNRVLSAALDAGCDVLHPGRGPLAESLDFHDFAVRANAFVLGSDTELVKKAWDRIGMLKHAGQMGIGTLRCSEDIPADADADKIGNTATAMGYPLAVRASHAAVAARVAAPEGLDAAIRAVRERADRESRDATVFLEGFTHGQRTCATVMVGDNYGSRVFLGISADSVGLDGRWWVAEMGTAILSTGLQRKLAEYTERIAESVEWVGIGSLRWTVSPSEGAWFTGISPSLPDTYTLFEALLGVDLIRTQLRLAQGEPLAWEHSDVTLDKHGVLVRLLHLDPNDGSRPGGVLERLDLGPGWSAGTAEGVRLGEETDIVLAEYVAVAATRQAALVKAHEALKAVVVEGVPTNRDALLALFDDAAFWRGETHVETMRRLARP